MALPGSTWNQLLQAINADFQRLDLLSATPVPSDIIWKYSQEAIALYQPDIFIPGQAYLQWASTFRNQKYYALPPDFEFDAQILFNTFGQNAPIIKKSIFEIDEMDVQVPAIIGPAAYYCLYSTAAKVFGTPPAWQAGNYTARFNAANATVPYLITDSNGNLQALTAIYGTGVSGGAAPAWPTVLGSTVVDGNTTNGLQWTTWFLNPTSTAPVMRCFPVPDQVYQMTAVYQAVIPMPVNLTDSNFWTVDAEAMIRHETEGLIRKNVTHEPTYQADFEQAEVEFVKLAGIVRKTSATGHARAYYL